jgi:tight adherence protein B
MLAVAAAWLLAAAPMRADGREATTIREVDTQDFPTVRLTVAARNEPSLALEDVRVSENGVAVTVDAVHPIGAQGRRVDAVLAIDVSNSMSGASLTTALAAARRFVEQVPEWMPVGIVVFSEQPVVVQPVTSDRAAVAEAVDAIAATTSQGTSLFDAVVTGSEMFEDPDAQHNLILVTDGRNTGGVNSLEAAVQVANEAGVSVHAIGLAGPLTDQETLGSIAERTGGSYAAISQAELTAVYEALADELVQQHVVEYRSKSPFGASVTVTVHLPSGDATTGFLAPGLANLPATRGDGALTSSPFAGPLGMALVAALTFLATLGIVRLVDEGRERRRREQALATRLPSAEPTWESGQGGAHAPDRRSSVVPRQVAAFAERAVGTERGRRLGARLEHAGWSLRPGEFVAIVLGAIVVAGVAGLVLFGPIAALAGALIGFLIPSSMLSRAARRRKAAIQGQLADTLMVIASSMRAGHSFLQSLDSAAKEIDEPSSGEFSRVLSEIRLGRDVDEALQALVQRVGSQDLEWAVTAIAIQRKIGGNLAEVLETVAKTIRERETLRRQVKVLSAEGRLSVVVLTVLPILIAAYLMAVNPDYLRTLTNTTPGVVISSTAGVLMAIGYVWMKRIVTLDV